jgi:hypothetical protein
MPRIPKSNRPAKPNSTTKKAPRTPKQTTKPDHGSTPSPKGTQPTTTTTPNPQGPADQAAA